MVYLGIDIGGTETNYGLIDDDGELGTIKTRETPMESLTLFLDMMGDIYDEYADQIEGMAVSMPGIIHSKTGYAVHGGSLKYIKKMNMVEMLETRCQTTIHVENDGKAATLGELWKGNLKNIQQGIMLTLGTGIGGGIIVNGELLKGHHYSAGEFSFIKTNAARSKDADYMFGFQNGIKKLFQKIADQCDVPLASVDGYMMYELIEAGNKKAAICLNEYCYTLAIQLFNLQMILDSERIIISGGISGNPLLIQLINKNVTKVYEEELGENLFVMPTIMESKFGNNGNIIGALYNYKLNEE
ncbi:Sugar kinase of the NBD/HSP70 family, may contain an N-terminal HTH domain [Carnobacterium alterfunditum]|uniref:Sugar kinase of the NBD/HSP70 family, may contain an N-terminal HTH domain n=1 Tax=Carnobacterium alterfunditum TaxID=28230 RepID=A0A1N6HUF1_9LACT|nr:ROK family protein [Carnobacterium alterfunditum]SIO23391.1 Sugar kinase of the NBD/HSP70 family, may contain an N-terminal HTH domain [Carnobacterium alterfunditum]